LTCAADPICMWESSFGAGMCLFADLGYCGHWLYVHCICDCECATRYSLWAGLSGEYRRCKTPSRGHASQDAEERFLSKPKSVPCVHKHEKTKLQVATSLSLAGFPCGVHHPSCLATQLTRPYNVSILPLLSISSCSRY
jgi:hypothetical protein